MNIRGNLALGFRQGQISQLNLQVAKISPILIK